MGRIFRRKHKGQPSGCWIARLRNASGVVVEKSTKCRERRNAEARLREWEQREERIQAGVLSHADAQAMDWAGVALARHVEDYAVHLEARGVTARHIGDRKAQLARVFSECGFVRLADLERLPFERWLNAKAAAGMSAARRNVYHAAVIAFAHWLVQERRMLISPFAQMPKANERADRRRIRRALTAAEITTLLQAAQERPLYQALHAHGAEPCNMPKRECARLAWTGRERALLYKTMLSTGLRLNEVRSLTVGQAHLSGPKPYLELAAKDEKNRKGSKIPLRGDMAAEVALYLGERLKRAQGEAQAAQRPIPARMTGDAPLFHVPQNLSRVLDKDLAYAGIPKRDEAGRTLDVHSFRHSFASHLNAAGVAPRVAQALLRHSDIRLTMNTYQDLAALDVRGALDRLPDMRLDGEEQAVAEAVQGAEISPPISPLLGDKTRHFPAHPGNVPADGIPIRAQRVDTQKPPYLQGFSSDGNGRHEKKEWRPQGDLNPCRRRERAVS